MEDIMKKAVIFDLYGTLIDLHTDEDNALFWQQMTLFYSYSGAHYEALQEAYLDEVEKEKSKIKFENPDIEILEVFSQLYKNKGLEVDAHLLESTATTFRLLSTDYIQLYPGVIELLQLLKAKNIKIILLSNAQQSFTLNELKLTGIKDYFDQIYISSDYKMCKPNPDFYNIMLKDEGLTADECVYIGNDHTTDIKGANAIGMDSIYLHTNCSQDTLDDFECLHKIIPGNLYEVIKIVKSWA